MTLVKAKQIAGGGTSGGGVASYSDLTDAPPLTKQITFVGTLEPTAGTAIFQFPKAVTLTKIYALVGVQSISSIEAKVKKNGVYFATLTIPALESKSNVITTPFAITDTDILAADITSANGGENLIIIFEYA